MIGREQIALDCGSEVCKENMLYSQKTAVLEEIIRNCIKDDSFSFEIFDLVDSTNSVLKKMAEQGAKEKTVVIANEQSGGRGRLGRSFFSPADSGIYMSVLLKPDIAPQKAINITTCAAVAVCKTLERFFDVKPQIKWVNDIYINGKKVCGILSEASINLESNKPDYVILGVGLNLYAPKGDFPSDLTDIADSVLDGEKLNLENKGEVIAQILHEFFELYSELGGEKIYNEYKSRMFLLEKRVNVTFGDGFAATIVDINDDFSLKVKKDNGEIINISSGEVSIRPLALN